MGRPRIVLAVAAGELESKEVEGDLDMFIESESAEGEALPGEPATGEIEPILRS